MGYFDFLIDPNQSPIPGQSYLYNLNMVWRPGCLESLDVPKGKLIATNVRQLKNYSFVFNLQGMDGEFRCNYGWAFVEITKENLAQFERCRLASEALRVAQKIADAEYEKLKTLKVLRKSDPSPVSARVCDAGEADVLHEDPSPRPVV